MDEVRWIDMSRATKRLVLGFVVGDLVSVAYYDPG